MSYFERVRLLYSLFDTSRLFSHILLGFSVNMYLNMKYYIIVFETPPNIPIPTINATTMDYLFILMYVSYFECVRLLYSLFETSRLFSHKLLGFLVNMYLNIKYYVIVFVTPTHIPSPTINATTMVKSYEMYL